MADDSEPPHHRDWSHLPPDLLSAIATHLTLFSDYIRLRSVCHNFLSFLPPSPLHNLPCQLPWLLLPPPPPPMASASTRHFHDLLAGKLRPLPLPLPESSYPRRICGSSHGWLVLAGDSPEILCLNPLTAAKHPLPPLSALPCVVGFSYADVGREYSVRDATSGEIYAVDLRRMRDETLRKFILSNGPSSSHFVAMGIINSKLTATSELVFCINGGNPNPTPNSWRSVPGLGFGSGFSTEDVIYSDSDSKFYAVNKSGDVAIFNLDDHNDDDHPQTLKIMRTLNTIPGDLQYLVISDEDLFLVSRSLDAEADIVNYCEVYQTTSFDVSRFREVEDDRVCWDRVTDLGDRVVFVGDNHSLALKASDFSGLRSNCIYFTDDHSKSNDVGVFDLGSNCVEPLLHCFSSDSTWDSPIWVTPNPC